MSYDRYEREYHLTPAGWVVGTFAFYGRADDQVARPPETLLTIVKEVEQSSGYSPEVISWREQWRSPDATDTQIKNLHKKFGDRPTHTE